MEKQNQLPTFKLVDNIPAVVQFDGVLGKEIINEQYGTTSYMYIIYDVADEEKKKVWFATAKQHEVVQQIKPQLGKTYSLLKEKLPEDKYTKFKIVETAESIDDSGSMFPESSIQSSASEPKQKPRTFAVSPEAAAWAIKTAVFAHDIFERNHLLHQNKGDIEKDISYLAEKFLVMQNKLMSKTYTSS